jgi:hypothetical protein
MKVKLKVKVKVNVRLSLYLIKHHAMNIYRSGGLAPSFLTLAIDGCEW